MINLTSNVSAQSADASAVAGARIQNNDNATSAAVATDDDDGDWNSLSREEWKARSRRRTIARYLPGGGMPSVDDIDQYIDKFGDSTVYDSRYYRYKITADHIAGTTGSIKLSGEVFPANYKDGISNTLKTLGFNIVDNAIVALPKLEAGQPGFGISTTTAATLRREPRRRAEQLNSVARGGWMRVLRNATAADITSHDKTWSHHAPGAETLALDSPEDWVLAQTMEGYIGFARKTDFDMRNDYRLPDGILKMPVKLADEKTTLPAGVYVYGDPDSGWHLFTKERLPDSAQVTDLRPAFTAEQILKRTKPFMGTGYVWGGVTDEGIDCSGFSQFFMRTAGVMLPRDAVQQATSGLIVGWGADAAKRAQPGDLIFFHTGTGRINHVAISLGDGKIIHSAGPGVHISNLSDSRHGDSEETLADGIMFARRMMAR